MSETAQVVSKGATEKMNLVMPTEQQNEVVIEQEQGGNDGTDGNDKTQAQIEAEAAKLATEEKLPEFSEEQRVAFLKSVGFEGSIEDLKTKLQPVTAELTPEQSALKEKEYDKRLLDLYVSKGGTVDNYVSVKQIMSADVNDVSRNTLHKDLVESGLDEEDAKVVAKQMFLEQDLENLVQDDEETEADFISRKSKLEKKISSGAKILANLGLPIINKAKGIYEALQNEIKALDEEKAEEVELSNKIDVHFQELPKEFKIELGEVNGKAVEPISMKIPAEAIARVSEILKDVTKRTAIIYDNKGKLNFTKLAEILLRNETLEAAAKSSYTEGQTRQVAIYKSMFPDRSAHSIGVGGAASKDTTQKTAPVSRGEKQQFRPLINQ